MAHISGLCPLKFRCPPQVSMSIQGSLSGLRQLPRSLVVCAYERVSATKAGLMVTQPLWSLKVQKFLMFQSAHNSPDRGSGDASPQMGSNQSPCSNAQKAPSIQNCCGNDDRRRGCRAFDSAVIMLIQLSLPAGVGAANKVS